MPTSSEVRRSELGAWADGHADVLELVWEVYSSQGEWPDAKNLTRQRFSVAPRRDFTLIARAMPPQLGRLETASTPNRIVLTPRGLSYVRAARPLLDDFARLIRLGIDRFADCEGQAVFGTAELQGLLGVTLDRARQLEEIVRLDGWLFSLSGGGPGDLRVEVVDHTALVVADVHTIEQYLDAQADAWWPDPPGHGGVPALPSSSPAATARPALGGAEHLRRMAAPQSTPVSRPERSKRYLVVGSDGHGRGVTCYRWDKLPGELNVADYDIVILNFAAFEETSLAEGLPVERLPSATQMARLLFSPGSEIIAIGDPRTAVGNERVDYWLPCVIGVEDDSGTSYEPCEPAWEFYFAFVSGWRWIATGKLDYLSGPEVASYLKPVTHENSMLSVELELLAQTRFQKGVGLRLNIWTTRLSNAERRDACSVFWLPTPDQVSPSEAISAILGERYGVAEEARTPEWAAEYALPAEAPLAAEIAALEDERRAIDEKISNAESRAADAARPKLLLYEQGKAILEPIVRETLRELGARVEDPQAEGIEDGTLFWGEYNAVLEIKGRTSPIKQDDVRQVVQWGSQAELRDGIDYKRIIVGNAYCDVPPVERGDPLAPNAKTYAQHGAVAVVTTVQLYEALRQKQAGELDESAFWQAVFGAKALADLPEPQPLRP